MIGNYSTSTATRNAVHISSGRATVRPASVPDIAGIFGNAFKTTIRAGLDWYQGVIDTGKALQGASHSSDRIERTELDQNERVRKEQERIAREQMEQMEKNEAAQRTNGLQGVLA